MSVLQIVRWPDPGLTEVCAPVGEIAPETRALAENMLETMYAAPGRGLAAPQVGVQRRLFVMDVTWKEGKRAPMVFVDPEILWSGDTIVSHSEGCLSIPGISVEVPRPDRVRCAWRDLEGRAHSQVFEGFAAVCVQHELDHLNGIVTLDHVDADRRAELLADYDGLSA